MDSAPHKDSRLAFVRDFMTNQIPFNRLLGIQVVELGEGHAVLCVDYRPELVGDPMRPALHGGIISALVDTCGGAAVWTTIGEHDRISTIDMRVDYLRPAPLERILATADVIRIGNRVGVATVRVYPASKPSEVCAEGKAVYSVRRTKPGAGA